MSNQVGIYMIYNRVTGVPYIGQSVNIKKRISQHFEHLRKGTHSSRFLQRSFNQHGESAFEHVVLELCFIEEINVKEQFWIDFFKATTGKIYNAAHVVGSRLGIKMTEESKEKMRKAALGRIKTDETRRKLSEALKKNNYVRCRPNMKGFVHTAESRAKMSASMKGRVSHRRKKVICLETNSIFESANATAKYLGKSSHSLIAACCRGEHEKAYGLTFRYVNE